MRPLGKIVATTLVLLLGATVYGLIQTSQPPHASSIRKTSGSTAALTVDQTPILTAESLAEMSTSKEELPLAQQALEISDHG